MMIARISERGQLSIPAAARKKLGIKLKSNVVVEVGENEITIKPMRSILEVAGVFLEYTKDKTTDWDTIRDETMNTVAQEIESETRA